MLLVPLTVRQIHSMQRMQQHLPEMKAIQKRFKNDRRKQNEELMKFYKENQINPASSCLPIIPQIPIFFALYFVLRDFDDEIYPLYPESDLELARVRSGHHRQHHGALVGLRAARGLRGQPGGVDLVHADAEQGPAHHLPVLPFIFAIFILDPPGGTVFPVGLLIYWMTTNLWTVGQGIVTRGLRAEGRPRAREALVADASQERAGGRRSPCRAGGRSAGAKPQGQARRVKRKKKRKGARR